MIFLYRTVTWQLFSKFLPKHCSSERRIIPLSYHCSTTDPTVWGNEILLILPKVYISLLFQELKVADLSVLASETSHLASQQNLLILKATSHSSLTWRPIYGEFCLFGIF